LKKSARTRVGIRRKERDAHQRHADQTQDANAAETFPPVITMAFHKLNYLCRTMDFQQKLTQPGGNRKS
jgi:hypothetical protein